MFESNQVDYEYDFYCRHPDHPPTLIVKRTDDCIQIPDNCPLMEVI